MSELKVLCDICQEPATFEVVDDIVTSPVWCDGFWYQTGKFRQFFYCDQHVRKCVGGSDGHVNRLDNLHPKCIEVFLTYQMEEAAKKSKPKEPSDLREFVAPFCATEYLACNATVKPLPPPDDEADLPHIVDPGK